MTRHYKISNIGRARSAAREIRSSLSLSLSFSLNYNNNCHGVYFASIHFLPVPIRERKHRANRLGGSLDSRLGSVADLANFGAKYTVLRYRSFKTRRWTLRAARPYVFDPYSAPPPRRLLYRSPRRNVTSRESSVGSSYVVAATSLVGCHRHFREDEEKKKVAAFPSSPSPSRRISSHCLETASRAATLTHFADQPRRSRWSACPFRPFRAVNILQRSLLHMYARCITAYAPPRSLF